MDEAEIIDELVVHDGAWGWEKMEKGACIAFYKIEGSSETLIYRISNGQLERTIDGNHGWSSSTFSKINWVECIPECFEVKAPCLRTT